MKARTTRTLILSILTGALFAAAGAQASPSQPVRADYGTAAMDGTAQRTIVVDGHTRWANVTNGETVRFDLGGKRFTFTFQAWDSLGSVDLQAIAPDGVAVPAVRVYIAPNPLNQG